MIINKIGGPVCCPGEQQNENQIKRKEKQVLKPRQRTGREHESDYHTNYNWCTRNNSKRTDEGTGGLRNKRTSGDHSDNCIIKIGQNTKGI